MLQQHTIRPGAPLKPSMDFLGLREEALEVIRQLAGDQGEGARGGGNWTDHNLHDPGITILEQICYALTDLGYRLGFSVPDLLADALSRDGQVQWKPAEQDVAPSLPAMPALEAVLPSAPTTLDDWRRLFLDIEGIRSVAMVPASRGEVTQEALYFDPLQNELLARPKGTQGLKAVTLSGLYTVSIDAEEGHYRDSSRKLWQAFHRQRPVGEDVQALMQLQPAPVALVADLELEPNADPHKVLAQAFLRVDQYLAPTVRFEPREALEARGKTTEAIYDGPLLSGGFLDSHHSAAQDPKKVVYLSRVLEQILAVEGVKSVRNLKLKGQSAQIALSQTVNQWVPLLAKGWVPKLDPDPATVTVRVNGVAKTVDAGQVRALYDQGRKQLVTRLEPHASPPSLPPLRDRKVGSYQSIQQHFPDNYGINARGLPVDAPMARMAQAHQLKTWLLFFEQTLSNYFSKAGHLGRLYQFEQGERTHFPVGNLWDVPQVQDSFLGGHPAPGPDEAGATQELRRLERLLAHLVARFGHVFHHAPDSSLDKESIHGRLLGQVRNLLAFYWDLPAITQQRGQGTHLLRVPGTTAPVGGLKTNIARLLGLRPHDPDLVLHPHMDHAVDQVDFIVIEHILLRPLACEYAQDSLLFRFRNGKISRIHRLRSRKDPDSYRFRCFSTGTSALEPGDEVEIVFTLRNKKERFPVLEVTEDSFTIPVSVELATSAGNPQGGSWNKLSDEGANLYADPWSLQVTYALPSYHPKFMDHHHREYVASRLRQETPAHLAIHILWLDRLDMKALCLHYYRWREAYCAYLQDCVEGQGQDKLYMTLRHHRNALMRIIIAGETEPLRDLRIGVLPATGIVTSRNPDGDLLVTVEASHHAPLSLYLEEVEEGISYQVVRPASTTDGEAYDTVPVTVESKGAGLVLALSRQDYAVGDNHFCILAWDPAQQISALLHQKVLITLQSAPA